MAPQPSDCGCLRQIYQPFWASTDTVPQCKMGWYFCIPAPTHALHHHHCSSTRGQLAAQHSHYNTLLWPCRNPNCHWSPHRCTQVLHQDVEIILYYSCNLEERWEITQKSHVVSSHSCTSPPQWTLKHWTPQDNINQPLQSCVWWSTFANRHTLNTGPSPICAGIQINNLTFQQQCQRLQLPVPFAVPSSCSRLLCQYQGTGTDGEQGWRAELQGLLWIPNYATHTIQRRGWTEQGCKAARATPGSSTTTPKQAGQESSHQTMASHAAWHHEFSHSGLNQPHSSHSACWNRT